MEKRITHVERLTNDINRWIKNKTQKDFSVKIGMYHPATSNWISFDRNVDIDEMCDWWMCPTNPLDILSLNFLQNRYETGHVSLTQYLDEVLNLFKDFCHDESDKNAMIWDGLHQF